MNPAIQHNESPDALWHKCESCDELVFSQALERNLYICPSCGRYFPFPAEQRLHHIFASNSWTDLFPASAPPSLLQSLELTDLVAQTACPDVPDRIMAAGEGKISGYSAILAVSHPLAPPQRLHFVTLLIAIRTALMKSFPLICVYSDDAVPTSYATDRSVAAELSFTEITYLSTEMTRLSEARLPQITVLTNINTGALSTRFPTGDLILAEDADAISHASTEQPSIAATRKTAETPSDSPNRDAFVDHYISRHALPETLGKLLGFFAKADRTASARSSFPQTQ